MQRIPRLTIAALALLAAACDEGATEPTPAQTPSAIDGVWQFDVPSLAGAGLSCRAVGDAYRFTVRQQTIDVVQVPSDHFSLECAGDASLTQIHMPGLFVGVPHAEVDGTSVMLEWRYVTPAGYTERMRVDAQVGGDALDGVVTYRDARDGERFLTGRIVARRTGS